MSMPQATEAPGGGAMQIVSTLSALQPGTAYWVPAVVAPTRDWAGAPGCRRGARFLIDATSFRPGHESFPAFRARADCLRWIMAHRLAIAEQAPAAAVTAARLDAWILGMDSV
jgi:hypothetical protein